MVSKTTVRVGVSLLIAVGILTSFAGVAVADEHCDMDGFCEDDGEDDSYYGGPNPDVGGAVTGTVEGLLDPDNGPLLPVL